MTVTSEVARVDYVGNGSLATYSFTFPILHEDELAVYRGGVLLTRGVDYSVALNAVTRLGTITLTAGNLATGLALALVANADLTQEVNFEASNVYRSSVVGRAIDRLLMQVRQVNEKVRHALRLPMAENIDAVLSSAIARANKLVGFDASGNPSLVDQVSGGGSGGTGLGYDVTAEEFGAVGDGITHPLSAAAAAAFNVAFSAYGAQGANVIVAGDEQDFAAIQCAMWKAAVTGREIYVPPGTYRINRPLVLKWTATPITGQPAVPLVCRIVGAGRSSILKGYGIIAGRAVLELLGESNTYAANIEVAHLQVEEDATCHKYSYCIRAGDGYGIHFHRVICKGAGALALKVASSVTYAQICFSAHQCQFWSNWDRRWGLDDIAMDVYSVVPESLGSYWDLAKFDSCFFWGQVDCRAFNLKFESSMFINQVGRALPFGATVYLGSAAWDNCYFEDHLIGIATDTSTALVPITNIAIRNCHFSSVNNSGSPLNAQSSILCARNLAEHGPVLIENCRFGGTATVADIDLYGPMTVDVRGCCRPFLPGINTAPVINTAGDVRLIKRNPNGELAFDYMTFVKVRIECPIFHGSSEFIHDVVGNPSVKITNPNTGGTSSASLQAKSNDVIAQITAYHGAHATLPGYAIIHHDHATAPIVIAPGGLPRLFVDHTWARASRSWNGGYGFGAENTNVGVSAVAFYYLTNGADFAVFQLYGTGSPLAGQAFCGTSNAKKMHLGANGLFELTVDPADRRIRVREWGVLGGTWYAQTTTQSVHTTTGEGSLTFGGQGQLTVPANLLQVGSLIELDALVTEQAGVAVTFTFRFYAGAVAFTSLTSVYAGATAVSPKGMRVRITVKAVGAGGSMDWVLERQGVALAHGTQAIDTTTALLFYLSVQPDVSHVDNRVTCPQAQLKVTL